MYADGIGGRPPRTKATANANIVRLSDVTPRAIDWLWPGVIPIGKVTMLAGDPGLGKSFVTLDLASRVSTGRGWPDDPNAAREPAGVILISSEDALDDTVRPRLDAMQADCTRIRAIKSVEEKRSDGASFDRGFDLTRDINVLEDKIAEMEDCKLVVIDPISAFLGDANANENTDVRNIITQLSQLAERRRVAIVIVSHLRKGDGPPITRVMGSMGFVAASRTAWIVGKDPEDSERRLMVPLKNNLATDIGSFAYRISREGSQAGTVVWEEGRGDVDAEEIFSPAPKKPGPEPFARRQAKAWLHDILKDGPVAASIIFTRAGQSMIAAQTLRRAAEELGVVSKKVGGLNEWALPVHVQESCAAGFALIEQPVEFEQLGGLDDGGWPGFQVDQDSKFFDDPDGPDDSDDTDW